MMGETLRWRATASRLLFIILPLLVALAVSAIILMALDQDPGRVLREAWKGGFGSERRLASVLNYWIPLAFVSMGLVITFRAGLWNIGIEGQMIMGAVFASYVPLYAPMPPALSILASLFFGGAGRCDLGSFGWLSAQSFRRA